MRLLFSAFCLVTFALSRFSAVSSQSKVLQPPVQRAAAHPQLIGGLAHVAAMTGEHFLNEDLFRLVERHLLRRRLAAGGRLESEIDGRDEPALRHEHRPFDRVPQLTHVARPKMRFERLASGPIEAFELANFVVRGDDLAQLTSEATRREFVADRLMHRLPVSSIEQVERIDIAPWSVKGTLILRVWCRVVKP